MSRQREFQALALAIADTVARKQTAYGDSFGRSGAVMVALFPDGVPRDRLHEVLVIARVVDKLFRVATDNDPTGEDPWRDVAGYALLETARRRRAEPEE